MASTHEITEALRVRYSAPEFAFFQEVGDSGSSSRVYADGVAINMWASRGYAISGFEVKASRSDWLRELKQPEKAEPIITRCDYFYLVAPDEVFQPDEVPISWGILAFKDGKLREKRKAPKLEPKPITRQFVAQMFRRANDKDENATKRLIDKAMEVERAGLQVRINDAVKSRTRELEAQAAKWKRVTEALGESSWIEDESVIAAVKVVRKCGVGGTYNTLDAVCSQLEASAKRVRGALSGIGVDASAE